MEKVRGFEVIKEYTGKGINIPIRATKNAAGYDFEAAEDIVIPSIWSAFAKYGAFELKNILTGITKGQDVRKDVGKDPLKPTLVPTGIKSYMGEDEYLQLANRSSNPMKSKLVLTNGVGVIDSDYYNNEDNEGHIMFQFVNYGLGKVTIKKGERIGQGIFLPFLKADNDVSGGDRTGGFGSTSR